MFEKDILLENEHVLLRQLTYNDIVPLSEIAYDEEIWRYTVSLVTDRESLQAYVTNALSSRLVRKSYPFVIIDRKSGKPAGCSRYLNISFTHQRVEIGHTWLGKPYQRTGINRNAKFLLLEYAFEQLNMMRVEFKTDVRNAPSRKALLGIGAMEEGVLRSHTVLHDSHRRDSIYYSILKEEWEKIKVEKSFPK